MEQIDKKSRRLIERERGEKRRMKDQINLVDIKEISENRETKVSKAFRAFLPWVWQ